MGSPLGPENEFLIFELCTYHPQFREKMTAPVVGFKYATHETGHKCFFVVRSDGSEDGISVMKGINALFPKDGSRPAQAREQAKKESKKRALDEAEEPPAQKPKREYPH